MTKKEFLRALSRALRPMTRAEREKSLAYYAEMIDDRTESGLCEADAVAACGSMDAIAEEILSDAATRGALRAPQKPLNTALIVLGSPLWLALLAALAAVALAAVAVALAVYAVAWALILCMFSALLALAAGGLGCLVGLFLLLGQNVATAFAALGAGLVCLGLCILLYFPVLSCTKWLLHITAAAGSGLWNAIFHKGGES